MPKRQHTMNAADVELTPEDPIVRKALRQALRQRGIAVFQTKGQSGQVLRIAQSEEQAARAVLARVNSVMPRFRLIPLDKRHQIVRDNPGLITTVAAICQVNKSSVSRTLYSEIQSNAIARELDRQIAKLPATATSQH